MVTLAFAEGGIQLFPDFTMFIHIGMIMVMIWILNRTLFRPINTVIRAREKAAGHEGGEAGAILDDVATKEAKYSAEVRDARNEGYSLIEKEHDLAVAARNEKLLAAKAESAAAFDAGRSEIQKQTEEARAAIGTESVKLADEIAANILQG